MGLHHSKQNVDTVMETPAPSPLVPIPVIPIPVVLSRPNIPRDRRHSREHSDLGESTGRHAPCDMTWKYITDGENHNVSKWECCVDKKLVAVFEYENGKLVRWRAVD